MAESEIKPPPTSVPPARTDTNSGGGFGAWAKDHKGVVIGIGVVLVGGLYFLLKSRSSSSSKASTTTASTAVTYPGTSTNTQGFAQYQALANGISAGFTELNDQLDKVINGQTATNNPGGATTATTNQGASAGYGDVSTKAGPMVWLGVVGQKYYNVGAGAPVFFGNATTLKIGPTKDQPGNDIYTPVTYSQFVSKTPTS